MPHLIQPKCIAYNQPFAGPKSACDSALCSCVTPWIPDHDLPQPEVPPEVAGLRALVAAMHDKCMQSERFMGAVERQAAGMTAGQVEQLQV